MDLGSTVRVNLRLFFRVDPDWRLYTFGLAGLATLISLAAGEYLIALLIAAPAVALLWFTRVPDAAGTDTMRIISADERVVLRHPRRSDLDGLRAVVEEPGNVAAQGHATLIGDQLTGSTFEMWRRSTLMVTSPQDESVVYGLFTLAMHREDRGESPRSMLVGVFWAGEHTGRGLATEALGAALFTWQASMGSACRFELRTGTDNHGMRGVVERLGYTAEPDTFMQDLPDGRRIEAMRYRFDDSIDEAHRPTITLG